MALSLAELADEVVAHWLEHAIGRHELVSLGQTHPPDLGQLALVAEMDLGAVGGPGGVVDHVLAGDRMVPLTEILADLDPEIGLFLDLADDRVLVGLTRLTPASGKPPRRVLVYAAGDQDAAI
jgi:hypothetical protein